MEHKYEHLLSRLGYDITLTGAKYFVDVLDEICESLEVFDTEDKVKSFIPCYCLEYAHFYYGVGLNYFNKKLDEFSNSRRITPDNNDLGLQIYGKKRNITVQDEIMDIAKYISKQNQLENSISKPLVKSAIG